MPFVKYCGIHLIASCKFLSPSVLIFFFCSFRQKDHRQAAAYTFRPFVRKFLSTIVIKLRWFFSGHTLLFLCAHASLFFFWKVTPLNDEPTEKIDTYLVLWFHHFVLMNKKRKEMHCFLCLICFSLVAFEYSKRW